MGIYTVFGLAGATMSCTVEAESPEEAAENAELHASLCWQCSDKVDLGDVYEITVEKDGAEVYTDKFEDQSHQDVKKLAAFLKTKKRLPAEIAALVEKWT